ncbi:MAG: amidohydrolase family protein [Cephaloticoccus sp.]|nr:amidohydrolase family protein [Cephaloticoccus sp.]MCF7760624.1 amidohydrolase family protein [Cephaloticoccus sp.]
MPLIDAHIHLYPDVVNRDPAAWAIANGETHWATLCTRKRKNGLTVQSFPTVNELLRSMDVAGIARAVLLGWYWEHPESCAMQNRFYAECIRLHPDRLSAFAAIHPVFGESGAMSELGRARDEGLIGVGELSPHSQGIALADPVFQALMAQAGEWGMPVNLHVTDPASRDFPGKVATPLEDFVILATQHPQTTFILAHWGGLLPLVIGIPIPDNIFYDTAASPLLYPQAIWRGFCAKVPPERVLFGSDYPLNLYPGIDSGPNMSRLVAEIHRSELAAADLKLVVGANAAKLLAI